jgi:CRISPR-associated endonuclease/helicase Cas3
MSLTAKDFSPFFKAINGYDPFPWQARLAERVLTTGWPETIAMPTAAGKTACIDVAIFALAAEEAGQGSRRHARRIFFVIDRRIVVDEAFRRAARIVKALAMATDGVVAQVANRLRLLAGPGESPLATAVMRGGIYRDDRWAKSPAQPTVVVSTVDQVGSRLLYRGYGLSASAWPIHAGLVGNDALIIVDEAHCSRPFSQTLTSIARYRSEVWAEQPLNLPFGVVNMTATPQDAVDAFRAAPEDLAHGILGSRIKAAKPTRLVVARPKEEGFVDTVCDQTARLVGADTVVGIIVNRVATARAVHEAMKQRSLTKGKSRLDADLLLLTGRIRPLDRDALFTSYGPRIMAQPDRPRGKRALVVVATQCLEVGADVDFDALVSECCPLDALRQRFGRLNRLANYPSAPGVIVIRADQEQVSDDDPVYGSALAATWGWLDNHAQGPEENRSIDLGIASVDALLLQGPEAHDEVLHRTTCLAPAAPVILPSHVDCWAQTAPVPSADPDPAVYLHGPQRGAAEVHVVWRADLDANDSTLWAEIVATCPPTSLEALSLPINAVRGWLRHDHDLDTSDVEGVGVTDVEQESTRVPILRWCGPDDDDTTVLDDVTALRPGDTLIVPSSYGGCDKYGWAPSNTELVHDLGDQAQAARRRAVLRLVPSLVSEWHLDDVDLRARLVALMSASADEELDKDEMHDLLALAAKDPQAAPWLQRVASFLGHARRVRIAPHASGSGWVVTSPKPLPASAGEVDFTDEDVTASASSREVKLAEHLQNVENEARRLAQLAGLSNAVVADCALAARLHDVGKLDPRFQLWLHNGDRLANACAISPLAKSTTVSRTPKAIAAARTRAGYPKGSRHELVSVKLTEQSSMLTEAMDKDLVIHLVGAHHGHCRPFARVITDDKPVDVSGVAAGIQAVVSSNTGLERLDAGVAERFWRLVRRYGWWGLAMLEGIVRLADQRVSAREQEVDT